MRICYEELVKHQPEHIRQIAKFLGVPETDYTLYPAEEKEKITSPQYASAREELITRLTTAITTATPATPVPTRLRPESLRKPTLKVAISDYWQGVSPDSFLREELFSQLLGRHYTLELSDTPDILFFSVFGEDYKKYNCLKVLYTGENIKPPRQSYDFSFSFAKTDAVNFCFPLFVLYPHFWEFKTQQYPIEIQLLRHQRKVNFCNFIYSNDAAWQRKDFCQKLMPYKKVDCPGTVFNNMPHIGRTQGDKFNFMKSYKFSIAFENESSVDYTTEKIYHPFLVGSIPIYWGNPEISQWFNPASFINCHDYSDFEQVIERIIEIDNDEALYQSYRNAPPLLTDSKVNLINEEEILERLDLIAKTALSSRIKSS